MQNRRLKVAYRSNENAYFVHPTAIIDEDVTIGEGAKIWAFSHVMSGAKIGKNCIIGEKVHIGPNVTLGEHCKVQNGVNLYAGVTAEDFVFFGPNCQTTNEKHIGLTDLEGNPYSDWTAGRTIFRQGCSIGANAVVVCGSESTPTEIGSYAIVGAGAVVVSSVPGCAIVVGNPARLLRYRSQKITK
ncbi:MAG: N-acetyltransferase [Deltaproteobacteria bacterium]|nr:N-acetyltransferase [Deltaproteobacteria bacterium]